MLPTGTPSSHFEPVERLARPSGWLAARCDVVRLSNGELAVIKDLSHLDPFRRVLGRIAVRREHRAYERLAGLRGIPALLAVPGPFTLLLERINGVSLTDRMTLRDPSAFVRRLEALVSAVHARGVSHGEIRLGNVLVDANEEPWLVDFATAVVVDLPRAGTLFRLQRRLDRYGWLMIKDHLLPDSLTPAEREEAWRTRWLASILRHHVL